MLKQLRMMEVRQAVGAVTAGAAPRASAAKAHPTTEVVDIRGRFGGGAAVVAGKEGSVVGSYCRRGEGSCSGEKKGTEEGRPSARGFRRRFFFFLRNLVPLY